MEPRVHVILEDPRVIKKREREREKGSLYELTNVTCKMVELQIRASICAKKYYRGWCKKRGRKKKKKRKDTNQNVHGRLFTQFLDNLFDTFNKNICVWNFVLPQHVHQRYPRMVCFFCHTFPQLAFLTGPQKERRKRKGMREDVKVGGRWMHWGMKEGEERNQGCYK